MPRGDPPLAPLAAAVRAYKKAFIRGSRAFKNILKASETTAFNSKRFQLQQTHHRPSLSIRQHDDVPHEDQQEHRRRRRRALRCHPRRRRLLQDDNGSTCIQTSTPKDFIRIWGLELGGDAATNVEDLDGLPCDGQWEDFSKDSAPYLQHAVYSSMPATLKEVMAELKVMTGDPKSSVFRCGPKGVKWYTVNDFRGCTLRDGETFN